MLAMDTHQRCTGCRKTKPLAEGFYYETRSSKYLTRCKECIKKYTQRRRETIPGLAEHERELQKKSLRERKLADPGMGTWARKTPEQKLKAYEAVQRWRMRNPQLAYHEGIQGMRMRRSKPFLKAWPLIVAHYGGKCLGCGAARKVCFDHVVPLALQGANSLANGQPLCLKCNTVKGSGDRCRDYTPDKGAWIAELVRLNPWLGTIVREHGWHFTEEGKRLKEELDEVVAKDLIMPAECGGIGHEDGGYLDRELGSSVDPSAAWLTRVQKNNKRILDSLLANLPRE